MTVSQLIHKLQGLPQTAHIIVYDNTGCETEISESDIKVEKSTKMICPPIFLVKIVPKSNS